MRYEMTSSKQSQDSHVWPLVAEGASDDTLSSEKAAVINLLRAQGVGTKTVWKLIDTFQSAQMAISADDTTLERAGELKPESISSIREAVGNGFGEQQLEQAKRLGVRIVLPGEQEYPVLLSKSHQPPVLLFLLGNRLPDHDHAIAMVGRRKASEPGVELAHQIGAGLAKKQVTVVSGMAFGIDAAAHRGCMQENGHTVAVLGCGVDQVYPRQHRKLRDQIVQNGTIVSELFLGVGPEAKHFPMRNRIIAWMTAGTVVVEAAKKSGALITASYALQENRETFAAPGHPLSPGHEGCNYLLRQGATPVRHAGDILEDMAPIFGEQFAGPAQVSFKLDDMPDDLTPEEEQIFHLLDPVEKRHADYLSEKLKLDASRLGALLLGMELKGIVRRIPGDQFIRLVNVD